MIVTELPVVHKRNKVFICIILQCKFFKKDQVLSFMNEISSLNDNNFSFTWMFGALLVTLITILQLYLHLSADGSTHTHHHTHTQRHWE